MSMAYVILLGSTCFFVGVFIRGRTLINIIGPIYKPFMGTLTKLGSECCAATRGKKKVAVFFVRAFSALIEFCVSLG